MAKFCLKKPSKRQPARKRYKILKKIREHNRKVRKEAKNSKKKKPDTIQVPNICPFKEDILQEVDRLKKIKEDERKKAREAAKLERIKKKEDDKKDNIDQLVKDIEAKEKNFELFIPSGDQLKDFSQKSKDNSLKAYYKEFKKVIDASDIILEVLDARDPLGTRCKQVEDTVHSFANKRLVIILNKAGNDFLSLDVTKLELASVVSMLLTYLVPEEILSKWLKYFKRFTPAVPFKASTQSQNRKLGRKKMKLSKFNGALENSTCVGAELIMSVLANYCRNKDIKTSITVGVVGLPNVGKSSIINSLKRSRSCNVGAVPGVTKTMQEVQLDSKIKLIDSPGVVFASEQGSDEVLALRNAVSASALADPTDAASAILQRCEKSQLLGAYNIQDFSTPQEFFSLKAAKMGRFKKGGVPDSAAAARSLIEDWNQGKIKYFTVPPETDDNEVHVSAKIVPEMAKEFDIDSFEPMETKTIEELKKASETFQPAMKIDEDSTSLLSQNVKIFKAKKKNKNIPQGKKKIDPEMELDGNKKLNQVKKLAFKKEKKNKKRRDKISKVLANTLQSSVKISE